MNKPTDQGLTTFTFGDSQAISDRLVALVRCGKKTVTCSAVASINQSGEPIPTAGGNEIVLNWDGTKTLMVHIQSCELVRFCDVPEALALLEGENRTLEGRRRDHRECFERHSVFHWESAPGALNRDRA